MGKCNLPECKRIRLQAFDYSGDGAYFVTVCTAQNKNIFANLVGADIIRPNGTINLSEYGFIVDKAINSIARIYPNIEVQKYCIMPNHVHMILLVLPTRDSGRMISAPTLSTIIGQMKRYVSKECGFSVWQKSFYDRVIRDRDEYEKIWQYIDENPLKWHFDKYYITGQ